MIYEQKDYKELIRYVIKKNKVRGELKISASEKLKKGLFFNFRDEVYFVAENPEDEPLFNGGHPEAAFSMKKKYAWVIYSDSNYKLAKISDQLEFDFMTS